MAAPRPLEGRPHTETVGQTSEDKVSLKTILLSGIILLAIGGVASYFSISYFGAMGLLKANLITLAGDLSITTAIIGFVTLIGSCFAYKTRNK